MEDLPLGRIVALMPEFAVKDLPLGRTHDGDDSIIYIYIQGVRKIYYKAWWLVVEYHVIIFC